MNIPYTYLIGWSTLDKWYYGVRYSKKCHPDDLWNPYKTSSKLVAKFIKKFGDPDVIIIRKTFDSVNKARCWEHKVLVRLNVINKDRWINGHDTISFDPSLVPRGNQHWTTKYPEKWKDIRNRRKLYIMPCGDQHWTHQNTNSAVNHRTRMNSSNNPNNFLRNRIARSEKLKVENPVNLPGVKSKIKETLTGYKHPRKVCEHCGKDIADSIYTRWHGNKCKSKI
jgi:hypothetical protein